jgi:hypothetical protein
MLALDALVITGGVGVSMEDPAPGLRLTCVPQPTIPERAATYTSKAREGECFLAERAKFRIWRVWNAKGTITSPLNPLILRRSFMNEVG